MLSPRIALAFASIAVALSASSARADLVFDFKENGTGNLGVAMQTFQSTSGPAYTITATGTAGLYVKTSGGDEAGLGLNNDPTGDHEITTMNSIDLNVAALKGQYHVTSLTLAIGSVQHNENYQVYGGSIAPGNLLGSGTSADGSVVVTGANLSKYNDYIVTTTGGNILIDSATVAVSAVPEPSSLALMGIAGAVGLVVRRARKVRAA